MSTAPRRSLAVYFDRRMLRILLLGIISGFPWVLIGTGLSLWLKEDGLSRSTIGWAGLIFSVYAFNWAWAPLVDRIRIPVLTALLGHRKAWIVLLQMVILGAMLLWSQANPVDNLALVIGIGLAIALASATQDITIDALRIEQIGEHESDSMAAGAAIAVAGWWTGYKFGGMITLFLSQALQDRGVDDYWQMTFLLMGLFVVLCNLGLLLFVPEASAETRRQAQAAAEQRYADSIGGNGSGASPVAQLLGWFTVTIIEPLASFFRRNGVAIGVAILSFIFLFKIGEAFMGRMSVVFYKEIGFSKNDIAIFSKGLGWVVTVVATLVGGWFAIKNGVVRALFFAGIAMAVTNIMFSVLAWVGPSDTLFALAVVLDDIAAAVASVVFVAFISLLVDRTYTATQYALLASIGTAGRTVMASSSGELVDWLGGDWGLFFIITALMVLPSLVFLYLIRKNVSAAAGEAKTGAPA